MVGMERPKQCEIGRYGRKQWRAERTAWEALRVGLGDDTKIHVLEKESRHFARRAEGGEQVQKCCPRSKAEVIVDRWRKGRKEKACCVNQVSSMTKEFGVTDSAKYLGIDTRNENKK